MGIVKSKEQARDILLSPGMAKQIEEVIVQQTQKQQSKRALDTSSSPWESVVKSWNGFIPFQ